MRWLLCLLLPGFTTAALEVVEGIRTVNLHHSVVRVTEVQRLRDVPKDTFAFKTCVPRALWLCCIGSASVVIPSGEARRLNPITGGPAHVQILSADIPGVQDSEITLKIRLQIGKRVKAIPDLLGLAEKQTLVYEETPYILSPYPVKTQRIIYQFPKDVDLIEAPPRLSRQKTADWLKLRLDGLGMSTAFGTPQNSGPANIQLIYKLDIPLVQSELVERHVVLSHFRGTTVKDRYWIRNEAAKLKGSFNRWKLAPLLGGFYVRDRAKALPHRSLFTQTCILPPTAYDVQYFDEIGNISTSRIARRGVDYTELSVEPRYPLLGGWATDWRIEFRVRHEDFLPPNYKPDAEHAGRVYVVHVPATPSCVWSFVDKFVMTIALPHGAEVRSVVLPRHLAPEASKVETSELTESWFGMGRPRTLLTFTFGRTTVIDDHTSVLEPIVLSYVYDPVWGALKTVINYGALIAATLFSLLLVFNMSGRFSD